MSQKIKSVTGMNDIFADDVTYWQRLETTAHAIFSRYNFHEIRTPILEETGLFSRAVGETTQVVQKEMYSFLDRGGDAVTMRPEGTAGVVRSYIEHNLAATDAITKLYYMGPMFRYERPQKGRLRQFHQIGVELLGVDSPHADAEVIIMLDRFVRALGISEYRLEINTLGISSERKAYLEKLTTFLTGIAANLCAECQVRLTKNPMRVLDCKNETCRHHLKTAPLILDNISDATRAEFETLQRCLKDAHVEFTINPKIVRGLDYYEKTSFEFVSDKLGSQSAFVGGGRYNSLVGELGGENTPGIGFGMGCERTVMLMMAADTEKKAAAVKGVYICVFDENGFAVGRDVLQKCRDAGLSADMDFTVKSLKSQMRRAGKFGFSHVAIIGDDEIKNNVVALKDMATGEQKKVSVADMLAAVKSV